MHIAILVIMMPDLNAIASPFVVICKLIGRYCSVPV